MKFQRYNSKLGKVQHFSTLPVDTCYQDCGYCYSKKSLQQYPNVIKNYMYNTKQLNKGKPLPDPYNNCKVIRMYVSGDFQNIHTIKEWIRLSKKHKDKTFYGYTKQWQNKELLPYLNKLRKLDNVVLRASIDTNTRLPSKSWTVSGVIQDNTQQRLKMRRTYTCLSTTKKIKCSDCRICFSKKLKQLTILFPYHTKGRKKIDNKYKNIPTKKTY
jgi:hypothetical protein